MDMTPMIDCVFQLLLFFMVSSHFDEEALKSDEGTLGAVLPEAVAAMPMVMRPREMIININARGEQADWKHIARVMSLCNQAKISDYRVAVVPDGERMPDGQP